MVVDDDDDDALGGLGTTLRARATLGRTLAAARAGSGSRGEPVALRAVRSPWSRRPCRRPRNPQHGTDTPACGGAGPWRGGTSAPGGHPGHDARCRAVL